jgi:hypothetical protein
VGGSGNVQLERREAEAEIRDAARPGIAETRWDPRKRAVNTTEGGFGLRDELLGRMGGLPTHCRSVNQRREKERGCETGIGTTVLHGQE